MSVQEAWQPYSWNYRAHYILFSDWQIACKLIIGLECKLMKLWYGCQFQPNNKLILGEILNTIRSDNP